MINKIVNKPDPNTQNPDVLEQTINNFINTDLPLFVGEANATATDISDKHSEILTKASLVDGWNTNVNTKYQDVVTKHSEVTTMKDSVLSSQQYIDDKTAQFDTTVSNSLAQLDTYTTDKETQLETFKDEKIAQIQAEASDTSNVVMHFKMKSFGLEL